MKCWLIDIMEQQTNNGAILVFPNPAIDEIKIQNNSLDKIDVIEIKNIQGISVLKKEINSIEKEITLNISTVDILMLYFVSFLASLEMTYDRLFS